MAGLQDRSPVLIGVGQLVQRDGPLDEALDALGMLEEVCRRAEEDAGAPLLSQLDTVVRLNTFGRGQGNPVRPLAERLGAHPRRELVTEAGGQIGVTAANAMAERIRQGQADVVLIAGANDMRSGLRRKREGLDPRSEPAGTGTPERLGELRPGHSPLEERYGLDAPPMIYPLFENALRARRGLTPEEHGRRVAHLFSRFSEVAARNPHAWFPIARSAEEIASPSAANRMICFPYTKYLNAVLHTDQAAALLLCSAERARSLGIPEERQVHWWGGGEAQEEAWFASERPDFAQCPAMLESQLAALDAGHADIGDVDFIDFYSCFPVAVELAAEQLGLAENDPRGFTVTGGLPYAGGPASAYCLHSLAAMAERLRRRPGSLGLVTGNGWYLTKHAASLWSTAPPPATPTAPPAESPAAARLREMTRTPVEIDPEPRGKGRVEAYTVLFDREGAPQRGILLGRTEEGRRFLAWARGDRELLESLTVAEGVGRLGRLDCEDGTAWIDLR